jgi:GTP-binding protein
MLSFFGHFNIINYMNTIPVISIVGRPNVGKSTLFNKIIGSRHAIVSRDAGTTRDSVMEASSWDGKPFVLIDTAGLIVDFEGYDEAEIEKMAQEHIAQAVEESDVVLFVVDGKIGLTPEDKEVAKLVRKYKKRVILVANKADNLVAEYSSKEFFELGFTEDIAISAMIGRRVGGLLDMATRDFPVAQIEKSSAIKKLAIVGRPNVGKSTLFNALTKSSRAIVSDIAGTTRDSINLEIKIGKSKKTVEIIDTAGFRRRGKIVPGVEKFSVIRTINSMLKSDIVLLVVDAHEGLTRGDAHLCELAINQKKKVIIIINKLDLLAHRETTEVPNLFRYPFLTKMKSIAISAKEGINLGTLQEEIISEI